MSLLSIAWCTEEEEPRETYGMCHNEALTLGPLHRMLRVPGEAYISNWRWPLRRRYSIVLKSFLLTERCFWNSALEPCQPGCTETLITGKDRERKKLPGIVFEIISRFL